MDNENSGAATILKFDTAYIELVGNRLSAGNEHFRRTWDIAMNGLLSAVSFQDATTGTEWLAPSSERFGPTPAAELPEEARTLELVAVPSGSVVEAESLTAELTATGKTATLVYRFQVFPAASGVRIRLGVTGKTINSAANGEATTETGPTGIEVDPASVSQSTARSAERDSLEALTLAPHNLRLTQVTLKDQTDHHNELVSEAEWLLHPAERTFTLSGGLFYIDDVTTGAGLILLKEAPLPYARPVPTDHDLRVESVKKQVTLIGNGADETGDGYAFVTLAYSGGIPGRIAALQQYQRCLRPYVPRRDGMLLANTWGDRSADGRIRADFIAQEIEAGARLGADIIQIDDGWEVGSTSNSVRTKTGKAGVWEGFYAAWDNFWSVSPDRFPNGLEPLIAAAREKGMRFGLWFGPDSHNDFANWERDAATVLGLHRDLNVDYFKLDGIKVRSKTAERNLHSFVNRVFTETDGRVVFDLDITAEIRPGYFGMIQNGPLFVENRYTDWHRYWPHQTLRTVWKLAHHVDPVRLRMEWLNNERNTDKYAGDPLAPNAYRPDYLFATVMFTSPLGWFEISNLPESYFTEAGPLIATWKKHREAIFSGTILPIGNVPDGATWTGFASVAADKRGAYLLVFREASLSGEWRTDLPFLSGATGQTPSVTVLAGEGQMSLLPGERLEVTIPDSHRFLFVRVEL